MPHHCKKTFSHSNCLFASSIKHLVLLSTVISLLLITLTQMEIDFVVGNFVTLPRKLSQYQDSSQSPVCKPKERTLAGKAKILICKIIMQYWEELKWLVNLLFFLLFVCFCQWNQFKEIFNEATYRLFVFMRDKQVLEN